MGLHLQHCMFLSILCKPDPSFLGPNSWVCHLNKVPKMLEAIVKIEDLGLLLLTLDKERGRRKIRRDRERET